MSFTGYRHLKYFLVYHGYYSLLFFKLGDFKFQNDVHVVIGCVPVFWCRSYIIAGVSVQLSVGANSVNCLSLNTNNITPKYATPTLQPQN